MKIVLVFLAGVVLGAGDLLGQPYNTNLLVNPGGETGDMTGWTVTANGGSGWVVASDSVAHTGTRLFDTSYAWDTAYQTVDLLAAGFSAPELDTQPDIAFSEWIYQRFDSGGYYYLTFELLDSNNNPASPLAEYNYGTQASPIQVSANTPWFEDSYTFSGYGTGVRYLYIEMGGYSANYWIGWYGPYFDDASVSVFQAAPEPNVITMVMLGAGLLLSCVWLRPARC